MIKRGVIFLLVLVLGISFISAASTDISYFTVGGCDNGMPAGTCSADGGQYCDAYGILWNTLTSDICTTVGLCCPLGYYCDSTTEMKCVERTTSCSDYTIQDDCEDDICVWDPNDVGIPDCRDPSEFDGCNDYQSEYGCEQDFADRGQHGTGSEICSSGAYDSLSGFVVRYDSCRCEWDGECMLTHDVTNQTNPEGPDLFSCKRSFSLGECINKIQNLTWTAVIDPDSFETSLSPQQLATLGCLGSSKEINCGGPIVKLPFFGFFNIISVLGLLSIFYFKKDILKFLKKE